MSATCVQCEANARSNELGGYAAAAAECRAYGNQPVVGGTDGAA